MLIIGVIILLSGAFLSAWGICTYLDNNETEKTQFIVMIGALFVFASMVITCYHFDVQEEKRVEEYNKRVITRW